MHSEMNFCIDYELENKDNDMINHKISNKKKYLVKYKLSLKYTKKDEDMEFHLSLELSPAEVVILL